MGYWEIGNTESPLLEPLIHLPVFEKVKRSRYVKLCELGILRAIEGMEFSDFQKMIKVIWPLPWEGFEGRWEKRYGVK